MMISPYGLKISVIVWKNHSRRAAARVNRDMVATGMLFNRLAHTVSVEPVVMTSSTSRMCLPER